ncbi:hypothetical protein CH275_16845 [Rhodococcus sp. 06-235-1A]|uniref:hypothetical protein n=1 Tax=Rhodococcus sp. 06-235-1A TaxID=2022508 RepID=UPI000B9C1A68|nr:hypothetical protein [Rhodococcus sp. 06-235-1A]OZD03434.1 hypothetical protein CH275_16845 [Rhodococcus sp. 06-235-1A]
MTDDTELQTRARPGFGTAFAAAAFLLLLAGNRFEWWDYRSPWNLFLDLVIVWAAVAGLIVVGVVWIYRLYSYRKNCRRWPWPSIIAPVTVLVAAVAFVVIELPVDRDFERARTQMEDLAISMLDEGNQRLVSIEISGVSFSTVYVADNNCVYFVDGKRSSTLSRTGWLYTVRCTPNPNNFRGREELAPDWFAYRQRGS